ncbi:SAM-dependent methyltransferase [Streptomyces anulatus]|uniref:SAM-dependent methyltransferase n=1 Tax=Streptomyces anulatus TaxID=1892 RepID=UPI0004C6C1E1|nr:SAM-dependent methyltransferase [Streptomyces anulatus]
MVHTPDWVPEGTDTEKPSVARMYDFYVGGEHNLDSDRERAQSALTALPGLDIAIAANRAFLRRAVRYTAELGISQYLDIGSGIPTPGKGNTHDVARSVLPGARVAYLDHDPVAVARSRALLEGDPDAVAVAGDFLKPKAILDDPEIRALIDLDRPVALMLVAVLHFIEDKDDPWEKVAQLRDALAPGSALILSHAYVQQDPGSGPTSEELQRVYRGFGAQLQNRGPAETGRFFEGFTLVEPGLTGMASWRPDADTASDHPMQNTGVVGVAMKTS